MYKVYLDGSILYYPGDAEYVIYDAVVKLAIGQAGSCEFVIPPSNPRYNSINNRLSMITVYKNDKEIFCGEVRESSKDRNNCRKVYAVGELAFLGDTIQLQHSYGNATPTTFLSAVIANHNGQVDARKQFTWGYSSVSIGYDESEKQTDYDDTLSAIRSQIIENVGGCLRIRKQNGARILDHVSLSAYGNANAQGINFGENLLDYAENLTASDIATVVIPLGVRLDEEGDGFEKRLDIKSVNAGKNYITAGNSVLNNFGHVWRVVIFDGIDSPATLKAAGQQWLSDNQYETLTLKVTAVDLSHMDAALDDMSLGDLIPCIAEPYGMNTSMYIQEMTLNLMAPQKDTITMSATMRNKKMLVSSQLGSSSTEIRQVAYKQELKIRNVIRQEVANIMAKFTGSQGGYKLSEYDDQTGLWLRDNYMNAPSKAQATRIMEFSMNGIRMFNGAAGQYIDPTKWKTAWDFDGGFCADFILTGTMMAERVKAGILSDVANNVSWNLETGAMSAKRLSIDSTNFDLDENGNLDAKNATLTGATIKGGEIISDSGAKEASLINGFFRGYIKNGNSKAISGLLDLAATYADNNKHAAIWGKDILHLQAGGSEGNPATDIEIDSRGIHLPGVTGTEAVGTKNLTLNGGLVTNVSSVSGLLNGQQAVGTKSITFENGLAKSVAAVSGLANGSLAAGDITLFVQNGLVTGLSGGSTPISGVSGEITIDGYKITLDNGVITAIEDLQQGA